MLASSLELLQDTVIASLCLLVLVYCSIRPDLVDRFNHRTLAGREGLSGLGLPRFYRSLGSNPPQMAISRVRVPKGWRGITSASEPGSNSS